jgi:hypothetical protein
MKLFFVPLEKIKSNQPQVTDFITACITKTTILFNLVAITIKKLWFFYKPHEVCYPQFNAIIPITHKGQLPKLSVHIGTDVQSFQPPSLTGVKLNSHQSGPWGLHN